MGWIRMPSRPKRGFQIVLLVLSVSILFAAGLPFRLHWFGKASAYSVSTSGPLSQLALMWTRDWLSRPQVPGECFPTFETPKITPSGKRLNDAFSSQPPFAFIVLLYLPAKLVHSMPDLRWTSALSLANHWVVCVTAALLVYLSLATSSFGLLSALLFSLSAALLVLYLPGPLYYFQVVFWLDCLILTPFMLCVLLENMRDLPSLESRRSLVNTLLAATIFLSALLDYFSVTIVAAIVIKRLWLGQFGRGWWQRVAGVAVFLLPLCLGFAVIELRLICAGAALSLIGKFLLYSGTMGEPGLVTFGEFTDVFWRGHVAKYLFSSAPYMVWAAFVCSTGCVVVSLGRRCWQKSARALPPAIRLLSTIFMLTTACMMYSYLLWRQNAENEFTCTKYIVPLSCAAFTLLPALLASLPGNAWLQYVAGLLVLLASVATVVTNAHRYRDYFGEPTDLFERAGRAIESGVRDDEIVVGPRLYNRQKGAASIPCQLYCFAFHSSHIVFPQDYDAFEDLRHMLGQAGQPLPETLVVIAPEPLNAREQDIALRAELTWESENFTLIRIRVQTFLEALKSLRKVSG